MKLKECIPTIIKPQNDELIMSWIETLAEINEEDIKDFLVEFLGYHKCDHTHVNDFRKDQLLNLESVCQRYGKQGFPNVKDVIKKYTGYYAAMPFRKKSMNAIFSEYILRKKHEKRLFTYPLFDDEVDKFKVCPECMKEDVKKGHRKYVRVWHNLPCVTCCAKHGCKLVEKGSDESRYIKGEKNEIDIAKLMYQLYQKPVYGCLEQTLFILKDRGAELPKGKNPKPDRIIPMVAETFTYDEFVKELNEYNDDQQTVDDLLIERKCEICGDVYLMFSDAEAMGYSCPVCDSKKEYYELVERFVAKSNEQEYRLLELLPRGGIKVEHIPCGNHYEKNFLNFIRDGGFCIKCHYDRTGETATKADGTTMTIIRYGSSTDIDVLFENGRIVKHRSYEQFRKGITKYPYNEMRLGEKEVSKRGNMMTIIAYRTCNDIDVQFEDGTIVSNVSYRRFCAGSIKHPDIPKERRERIGETAISNDGLKMTIVDYRNALDIDIQFEDGAIVKNRTYAGFQQGTVRHPYKEDKSGEEKTASNGMKMKIIKYRGIYDIDIQFEDGAIAKNRSYLNFQEGKIRHPVIFDAFVDRVGEKRTAKNGMEMEIIAYRNNQDMDIRFEDGTIVKNKAYDKFLCGYIKNPNITYEHRIGETSIANNGEKMTIVRYGSYSDIDVQFEDGTIVKNKAYNNFNKGMIENPNSPPIKKERIGETRKANNGQMMTIIAYRGCGDIDIQFEDGTIVTGKKYTRFQNGTIRNPSLTKRRKNKNKLE